MEHKAANACLNIGTHYGVFGSHAMVDFTAWSPKAFKEWLVIVTCISFGFL